MPKKILFFTKFPPPPTGQNIGTKLVFEMLKDDFSVSRINTSYGQISPKKIGLNYFKYFFGFSYQTIKNIFTLHQFLLSNEVNIIYLVASPSILGILRNLATLLVARPHVDKVVVHVRNGNYHEIFESSLTQHLATTLRNHVDTFIFLSEELENRAAPYFPSSKRDVVRNCIDETVRCPRDEVAGKIDEHERLDSFRVLFLSNMFRSKGCMDVLHALQQLRDRTDGSSLQAEFIGGWPDEQLREEFSQFAESERLGKIIQVHGRVADREKIRRAYLDADVFVLPTYYPIEAQPRSIIEAMNAGTPIIATPHASIPEYVTNDYNGYLVSKKAPSEITRAILKLMDRSDWKEKALAARKTYEEMFSPSAVRESLLNTLKDTREC